MPDWLQTWLPLLPALAPLGVVAAALIAVHGYRRQKRFELDNSLVELRRAKYQKFADLAYKLPNASPEVSQQFHQLYLDLMLVATDEVIASMSKLSNYLQDNSFKIENTDIASGLLSAVILQMRHDFFSSTSITAVTTSKLLKSTLKK